MQKNWTINDWQSGYCNGHIQLSDLLEYVASIDNDDNAWIEIATPDQLTAQIESIAAQNAKDLPLYGIPFAVKDNIDVAGFHTTAGYTAPLYLAENDAHVIAKLKAAGAIVIGKTNLDQFATGLVGTRSPYGAVSNSFNPDYISGGSSSGSSVSVANGVVPFALGTDTAGSGRVPAGHNNIVGLKPTKGWFSSTGLIPACRLHDVISIFALSVDDAWQVAQIMKGYDAEDDYSRVHPATAPVAFSLGKVAIPDTLTFYGDSQSQQAFELAISKLQAMGYEVTPIDFTVFDALADTLYNDSWVSERTFAVEQLVARDELLPITRQIISQADNYSAVDAMSAEYTRAALSRQIQQVLSEFDALIVPTAPTIYTIDAVNADPLTKNSHMGAYTNFVNLADLSALALPNVIADDGLPRGITLIAPAWHDEALANFGHQWQTALDIPMGTLEHHYQSEPAQTTKSPSLIPLSTVFSNDSSVELAVVGAHLSGMPLNYQLTDRGGVLSEQTQTAATYQLFALAGATPAKPGLMRHNDGRAIEVEVWRIPTARFGEIVNEVPAPLGIGNVELADGRWVKSFICEPYGFEGSTDVTLFGGWRAYIAKQSEPIV
ncbi:allophanate hydrolase [Psychrobacter piscatorii]|uniref:allophanate hydrolase n=1 Tax=Psychrobacter piscatorii TaxID=554343 RepID=UPI001918B4C9|nr:allophanate hydrolase [Psychrobacter piscatorii]